MQKNNLTDREKKELINRIEKKNTRKINNKSHLEMYLSQTDRNYKDGDRN